MLLAGSLFAILNLLFLLVLPKFYLQHECEGETFWEYLTLGTNQICAKLTIIGKAFFHIVFWGASALTMLLYVIGLFLKKILVKST